MEYFNIIIIGAGLSGCTLGNLLLKKNKRVLIIEKQDLDSKDKLCGGIITSKSYKLLHKIYGSNIDKLNFNEFNSFKVKNENVTKEIKIKHTYTIYRKDLDDFTINEFIKNGGTILDKTNYDKIDFNNKIIYTDNACFKYDKLISADGAMSKVRKDLTNKEQRMNFALECETHDNIESIQIDFLNNFKGYIWKIKNNKTNIIGIGNVAGNKDIKDTFLNYFNLDKNTQIKGAFLPTGYNILLKKGNTFFVGDAAGLISPVTGEGIYYALSSAYNLSKSISILYKVRMLKVRFIILIHKIATLFVYTTYIRNFFYKYYGKSKLISLLIDLAIEIIL